MKTIQIVVGIFFTIGLLSSCKTMRGLGRDVQHLGNKIENKAEQHSGY